MAVAVNLVSLQMAREGKGVKEDGGVRPCSRSANSVMKMFVLALLEGSIG